MPWLWRPANSSGTGDGILDLAHLQHIDPAVLVEPHCLHVISSIIVRSGRTFSAHLQLNVANTTGVTRPPRIVAIDPVGGL